MEEHKENIDRQETLSEKPLKVALIGNPNVGKSVLFGAFTGRYVTVSNYPGTTVEVTRGDITVNDKQVELIDSPGVHSLVPASEDEKVTRNILLDEEIYSVTQVIDSKNLKRGLFITMQLIEMGLPCELVFNMYDEAGERGIKIDIESLSVDLGLPVLPAIATQRWGLDKVKNRMDKPIKSDLTITYNGMIEKSIEKIQSLLPEVNISKRSIAIMLLSGDSTLDEWMENNLPKESIEKVVKEEKYLSNKFNDPIGYILNKEKHRVVDGFLKRHVTKEEKQKGKVNAFLGSISMHPVWGIFVLMFVLYIMYKFVGQFGAGTSVDFVESVIFEQYLHPWAHRIFDFIFGKGFFYDLFVGEYGIITMAVTYAIAIVLPVVGYFFLFFSFLEDSGYLPRLAIMVDKIFKMMGLNGKSVLPMVLGLGCDTMATMTTRILETKKERIIVTLLLALGVPCSAQLGVILGMLGGVSMMATIWWGGTILLVLFVVSFLASKIVEGETSDFILEVPPIRMPKISNIILKTFVRVEWYLKEAVPLFVLGTLILFFMDRLKMLVVIEKVVAPVVQGFLDLPVKTTEAFLVGFLRRDYGAAGLFKLQKEGGLDDIQVVVSLVTMTLFMPCIANLFMIIKERGMKTAVYITAFIFPFAFFVGALLNFILRYFQVTF